MSGASAPVSELERRYRRALAWYPRRWRRVNADALLGTLLDTAEAERRSTPCRGERLNLAVNGIAARVETVLPRVARDLASTFALVAGLAILLAYFVVQDWSPWDARMREFSLNPFGPFASVGVLVTAIWVVGAVLLVTGRTTAARLAILASVPLTVVILAMQSESSPEYVVPFPNPDRPTFIVVVGLALIVASGRPSRRWLVPIAAVVGAVGLTGWVLVQHRLDRTAYPLPPGRPAWLDFFASYLWNGPATIALLTLTVALVSALILALRGRSAIATALVWLSLPWIVVVTYVGNGSFVIAVGAPTFFAVCWLFLVPWTGLALAVLLISVRAAGRRRISVSRG